MKKIFLVLLLMLLVHQPANAVDYVEIPHPTGVQILLDMDFIEVYDDHVRVWLKLVPGADSIEGFKRGTHPDAAYFTQLNAFQKAQKTYQILKFEYYNENDGLVLEEEFPYEADFFQRIPDGSYMSTVYDEVMKLTK